MQTESEKRIVSATLRERIEFRIEKFKALMYSSKPGKILSSEGVSSELAPRAVWKISVYPNGWREGLAGNTSVFLELTGPMAEDGERFETAFVHMVVGAKSTDRLEWMYRGVYDGSEETGGITENHEEMKKLLEADGSLLVSADVEFSPPYARGLEGYEDGVQWAANFAKYYGDMTSSDCSIEVGSATIRAHKSILIPHSPVMQQMFTNPMAEASKSGVIKVPAEFMHSEAMRLVIRYCYQGRIDEETKDGEWTTETFKLADYFGVVALKAILERHMVYALVHGRFNVRDVLAKAVLADAHSANKLKEACIRLILDAEMNGENVFESDAWAELEESHPDLAAALAAGPLDDGQ